MFNGKAFTLIELIVVVSIIALLAAVAIPKYGELLEKANLGATLGNLSTIRSAISMYNANNFIFPSSIDPVSCIGFKEFIGEAVPYVKAKRPYSNPPYGNSVTLGNAIPDTMGSGWYYNNSAGYVYINSIANDIEGKSYTIY